MSTRPLAYWFAMVAGLAVWGGCVALAQTAPGTIPPVDVAVGTAAGVPVTIGLDGLTLPVALVIIAQMIIRSGGVPIKVHHYTHDTDEP